MQSSESQAGPVIRNTENARINNAAAWVALSAVAEAETETVVESAAQLDRKSVV